ncbi:hypothetical protein ABPG72_018203 [Tetrahymena utriculariae]
MFWKDENVFKNKHSVENNPLFGGKEKSTQSDCRFIPSRRGTNTSYNQYLLKENINTQNIINQNGSCFSQSSETSQPSSASTTAQSSFFHFGNSGSGNIFNQQQQSQQSSGVINSDEQAANNNQSMIHNASSSSSTQTSGINSSNLNISYCNSSANSYQKLMEDCLFQQEKKNQKKRVLNFRSESGMPIPLDKCISKTFEQANQQFMETNKIMRYISPMPERILDAPQLSDDYYLNLMDWGDCGTENKGTLAICLGSEVYLWDEYEIVNLFKTNQNVQATSVSWMNLKKKNCLAVGFSDNTIQLWDTEKCIPYRILKGHTGRVSSLSWNNYILSSGSRDTQIINHDIRQKNNIIKRFQGHEQEVCGLKWSPDGTQLASGGNDNTLRIWDINYAQNNVSHNNASSSSSRSASPSYQRACFYNHKAAVKALAWCPWQKHLLASGGGTQDKTIKFWNTDKMELVNSINCGSQVCSILWNPQDKELISSHGFQDNQLIVWSYPSMQKITELHGHTNRVLHMALSPDGSTVCSASSDETLRFWKVFPGSRYDRHDYDDSNPFTKHKRDGLSSQNLFIR